MSAFANSKELRDLFGGFLGKLGRHEQKGFSGSGIIMAYTVTEPSARFVIDAREAGHGYALFVDDERAPKAVVDVHLTGDTLDSMFCGDLNVMTAMAQGRIKAEGDQLLAVRMLPLMFRVVPLYKAFRADFYAKHAVEG